jgi:HEPN domain-containing protein
VAKEWLKAAQDDLILLEDIKNNNHITNLIAFHSQQAIEKSLKALLEYQHKKVPRTHKLQQLVDVAEIEVNDTLIQILDELYIDARYPSELGLLPAGKPSIEDAREFYEFAVQVFNQVCTLVGIEQEEFYGG